MTDRLIDDLGRALARPMTRRRTMRLFLAGGAALALPPLRPRLPIAQAGATKLCFAQSGTCAERYCGEFDECCQWVNCPECDCTTSRGCCNPCGFNNRCGSGGCEPGGSTCDQCCKWRGQGEPSFNAYPCECCAAGEIYVGGRTGCCTPRIAPDLCNISEPRCRNKTFNRQKAAVKKCNQRHPFKPVLPGLRLPDNPAGYADCMAKAEANNEPRRRCPQVPSDAHCRNGPCDPATLTCKRDCEPNSAIRSASGARQVADQDRVSAEPVPADRRRAAVSKNQLLRLLRARQPRLRRSYLALIRQLEKPVVDERSARELAAAYAAHRKDLLKLRTSLARGRGGRPQRLLLALLDSEAAGLAAYRQAILATSDAKSASFRSRGSKALLRAGTQATRVRGALGCDQYSC